MPTTETQRCAAQHFGLWLVEPGWLNRAWAAIRTGAWKPEPQAAAGTAQDGKAYDVLAGGIALITLQGQMTKRGSSFGGAGTVDLRRAVRAAARDADVAGILLYVDSPGGTAAGTKELADEVQAAGRYKPVHAFVEDMGASAAYWVASQAGRLSVNAPGSVGSIGTMAVVEDTSGKAELEGVKVHVITSDRGEGMKGAFAPGAPVTEQQLAYMQQHVEEWQTHFNAAVARGRRLPIAQVRKLADGRIHMGAKAQELGLVDAVEDQDAALRALRNAVRQREAAEKAAVDRATRLQAAIETVEPQMPYPNEHACRLKDPGQFQAGSFRRTQRKHDGKAYGVIMGRLKKGGSMAEQAYRYPKATWTVAQARAHCDSHGGKRFEPAAGSESTVKVSRRTDAERRLRIIKARAETGRGDGRIGR